MTRTGNNQYVGGRLINGYDYDKQAWVVDGKYIACGHPVSLDCGCYGRVHAGEQTMSNLPDVQLPEELSLAGPLDDFKGVKVGWKDEGDTGPVFLMDKDDNCARGQHWVTRAAARKMAKELNLPFEEY